MLKYKPFKMQYKGMQSSIPTALQALSSEPTAVSSHCCCLQTFYIHRHTFLNEESEIQGEKKKQ